METGCFMTFLGIFSTQDEKYYFCMDGSTQDEIEPTQGEIEHQNKYPSGGGGVWARWGAEERGPE